MIECKGLLKQFYSREKQTDFELRVEELIIPEKNITLLLGPNGAGKSTLLKSILDLVNIDDGEIYVDSISHKNHTCRKEISFLPESISINPRLSVDTFLDMMLLARVKNKEKLRQLKSRIIEDFNIDYKDKKIQELSKGMHQNVLLGFTLSFPDIKYFILDEPYNGLDFNAKQRLNDKIKEFRDSKAASFLISSHEFESLSKFADQIYLIDDGKIINKSCAVDLESSGETITEYYQKFLS